MTSFTLQEHSFIYFGDVISSRVIVSWMRHTVMASRIWKTCVRGCDGSKKALRHYSISDLIMDKTNSYRSLINGIMTKSKNHFSSLRKSVLRIEKFGLNNVSNLCHYVKLNNLLHTYKSVLKNNMDNSSWQNNELIIQHTAVWVAGPISQVLISHPYVREVYDHPICVGNAVRNHHLFFCRYSSASSLQWSPIPYTGKKFPSPLCR